MTIEERLEKLERNNRHLVTGLVAMVLLGVGVAATPPGMGVVDVVRARSVEVVDVNDTVRSRLDKDGIFFSDVTGKVRAVLAVSQTGPALAIWDANGKMRSRLATAADGSATALDIFDTKGELAYSFP